MPDDIRIRDGHAYRVVRSGPAYYEKSNGGVGYVGFEHLERIPDEEVDRLLDEGVIWPFERAPRTAV